MKSTVLDLTPAQIVIDICNSYDKGLGVFKNKGNAEDFVPKMAKELQVQYLFWVIQMDYATKSSKLYENANHLFSINQDWLEPNYFLEMNDAELFDFIRQNFRPRYPNEIVKRFRLNGENLINEYSGVAYNIVAASSTAQELLSRIREFRGFGEKLANFLIRTYIDLLKLDYSDINEILPPVDVHDVRLTYEWGFIKNNEMTDKNIQSVKHLWSNACKETGKSWITFDKALWLIGSNGVRTLDAKGDYLKNLGLN